MNKAIIIGLILLMSILVGCKEIRETKDNEQYCLDINMTFDDTYILQPNWTRCCTEFLPNDYGEYSRSCKNYEFKQIEKSKLIISGFNNESNTTDINATYGLFIDDLNWTYRSLYSIYLDWTFKGEFENITIRERQIATYMYFYGIWDEDCRIINRMSYIDCKKSPKLITTITDTLKNLSWEKEYYNISDFTGEDDCWNVSDTEYCFIKYN